MSQDTNVSNLIINKLNKVQYEGITNPSPTELYFVTDEGESISTLGDVTLTSLANGQVLQYDSTSGKWKNVTLSSAGNLANLGDVTLTTPSNGQVLQYNSTSGKWENAALSAATSSTAGVVKIKDTYDSTSTDAISGVGVADALSNISATSAIIRNWSSQ